MNKQQIRLTEEDLHFLIESAVENYLTENGETELFDNLRAGMRGVGQKLGRDTSAVSSRAMANVNGKMNRFGNYLNNKVTGAKNYMNDKVSGAKTYMNNKGQQMRQYGQDVRDTYQRTAMAQQVKGYVDQCVNALSKLYNANMNMKKYSINGVLPKGVDAKIDELINVLQSRNAVTGVYGKASAIQNARG